MKIVLATPLYPPEIGGPATYTKEVEQELLARGVPVSVVKFSDVRHLPKGVRHFAYAWSVYRAARGADVVFAQDAVSVGFPALIASRFARVRFFVRVPGDHAWEQGRERYGVTDSVDDFQKKSYGFHVGFLRTIERFVVQHAAAVIVPSRYFERIVSGWGTPAHTLHVMYNGIRLPLPPVPPAQGIPGPFILSVGRLVPWKGFEALIDLMVRMPEWRIVIVGDGPLRGELIARARRQSVEDRVHVIGSLRREEVLGWYQKATAFVLNTSFESFSFQIVEAMAAGVPIIATHIGSIPELITDTIHGRLVVPNDVEALAAAIESVRNEPDVWKTRTEAAKEKAQEFSITKTTDALLQLFG